MERRQRWRPMQIESPCSGYWLETPQYNRQAGILGVPAAYVGLVTFWGYPYHFWLFRGEMVLVRQNEVLASVRALEDSENPKCLRCNSI